MPGTENPTAEALAEQLQARIDAAVVKFGSTVAVNLGHRIPLHWPPHAVSYDFHVLASDWDRRSSFEAYGKSYEVEIANTPHGVFGRCPKLWHEARGQSEDEVLTALRLSAEPLFKRRQAIADTLGHTEPYEGTLRELNVLDLFTLLYCRDRDVANEARTEIEKHTSLGIFGLAIITILKDRSHPYRRSAQWCVLDLCEDLPRVCPTADLQKLAIEGMEGLLWDAEDDYARAVYKAGVVLGGHVAPEAGAPALFRCLKAPSKIGRRSAIHALFHIVEWAPDTQAQVVAALREVANTDPDAVLRPFAKAMADDIEAGRSDHIREPVFDDEP